MEPAPAPTRLEAVQTPGGSFYIEQYEVVRITWIDEGANDIQRLLHSRAMDA
ncbi:hypothetical protein [Limobrevibacterium gyesilva]|uniref:Uncharacterized protein n=1 Tax=Limobrevibacterium gyesilva TaxID=2991712 RepID=A0AA42CER5_9PROT|nr:hypothetical protein [Limobrevibacterium gyesilva]MCW3473881.1 hypothetical protein [Limobrevibacterium gyesilva]